MDYLYTIEVLFCVWIVCEARRLKRWLVRRLDLLLILIVHINILNTLWNGSFIMHGNGVGEEPTALGRAILYLEHRFVCRYGEIPTFSPFDSN